MLTQHFYHHEETIQPGRMVLEIVKDNGQNLTILFVRALWFDPDSLTFAFTCVGPYNASDTSFMEEEALARDVIRGKVRRELTASRDDQTTLRFLLQIDQFKWDIEARVVLGYSVPRPLSIVEFDTWEFAVHSVTRLQ